MAKRTSIVLFVAALHCQHCRAERSMAKRTSIVLFVAAVLALYAFPPPPRVMAVEFDGTWVGAVLEGNEIVPRLVRMSLSGASPQAPMWPGGAYRPVSEKDMGCWGRRNTSEEPNGWRERLSPQQAREIEDIYCSALFVMNPRDLIDCAVMRDGELVCN